MTVDGAEAVGLLLHASVVEEKLFRICSGVPRNLVPGGGQQIQLRTGRKERGSGSGCPLVKGSGGSCNLVQEISFHILKFS